MKKEKPNVIVLMSDDQGEWALGCTGNEEIITPNIDKLAEKGTMFNNFFCASPVCSPARASFLTGKIPSQHGVHDWLRGDNKKQEEIQYLEGQRAYTDILSEDGYVCGLSGKWHVGDSASPQNGFSHWYAHRSGGGPYYNAPMIRNGEHYKEPKYITDAITDDAIDFIEKHGNKDPFYLHVGYTAPHSPWIKNHPKEYEDLYKDCPFDSAPQEERHPDSIYLTDEVNKDVRANLVGYYAAVTAMDTNIGRIMEVLREKDLLENTIVVFTSDNGFSCGQHGFWGKGNGTFPINLYESSVKVPFIIYHEGKIQENLSSDALVSAYDFMPTLLDYLGYDEYEDSKLPGKSFAPILRGEEMEEDDHIVVLDEYGPNRMIRNKRYKYIKRYPYGPDEMYDLLKDPMEKENLLIDGKHEDMKNELNQELEEWFLKYVNPEIDGATQAVVGSGQKNLAGTWAKGEKSFTCDDYIKESDNYIYKPK